MIWPPLWWNELSTPQRLVLLGALKLILIAIGIYTALHMKGLV